MQGAKSRPYSFPQHSSNNWHCNCDCTIYSLSSDSNYAWIMCIVVWYMTVYVRVWVGLLLPFSAIPHIFSYYTISLVVLISIDHFQAENPFHSLSFEPLSSIAKSSLWHHGEALPTSITVLVEWPSSAPWNFHHWFSYCYSVMYTPRAT